MKQPHLLAPTQSGFTSPLSRELLALEPDLHILRGTLVALRTIGMSLDPIEPAAISLLARFGEEALARLDESWRDALSDFKT